MYYQSAFLLADFFTGIQCHNGKDSLHSFQQVKSKPAALFAEII